MHRHTSSLYPIRPLLLLLVLPLVMGACGARQAQETSPLGKFYTDRDLFLAHFDLRTDTDDLHSAAAVATMLADPRFSEVRYHAVAGAYGRQEGLYVPADTLFDMAFGEHWSDAHNHYANALQNVRSLVLGTLENGGHVWIAEGGQSDFSAAIVHSIREQLADSITANRMHVVQHSGWNEESTTPEDLSYIKESARYHKIPDGNDTGNGSPGFRTDANADWQEYITDPGLRRIWSTAIKIAHTYNGTDGRYLNESINSGGLDFSDTAETAWIFGFGELNDAEAFFKEFGAAE